MFVPFPAVMKLFASCISGFMGPPVRVLAADIHVPTQPADSGVTRPATRLPVRVATADLPTFNALRRFWCRVWPDAKAGAWRRIGPECLDGC